MALTVNTNIASLTAQRNLTGSQNSLSTSLERLSSGLRINSAKDDAAGLAISERFTAQIRGLNQGVRNANDGISLAQTAEGALKEVTSNLQRIRELAVQSANATNSNSDRTALQAEVTQLVQEIDRVASNTKFNGIALLDGTFSAKAFQVGANASETVSISSIESARTSALGASFSASRTASLTAPATITGGNVTINNIALIDAVSDGSGATNAIQSAKAVAAAINGTSGTGVTAIANATTKTYAGAATNGTAATTADLNINGTAITQFALQGVAATDTTAMKSAINAISAVTGVTASGDNTTGLTLTAVDGRNIDITGVSISGASTVADVGLTGLGASDETFGSITMTSSGTFVIAGAGANAVGGTATVNAAQTGTAMAAIDISTASGATTALASVDAALTTISSTRSTLGSYQARFESVVSNLQTTAENLSASRSRIMDADFASETANLTKAQILQQSGIAMLAQANAIPQNVLALLQ
jgi:flagellin